MTEPEQDPEGLPTEAEVLAHLAVVAHRVALRITEELPEQERERAAKAAAEVLLDDEGARELLGAAFAEGRADALRGTVHSGKVPSAPDFSDIESEGERRAIAREEHVCNSCSARDVCAISLAMSQVEALVVLSRCDRHR